MRAIGWAGLFLLSASTSLADPGKPPTSVADELKRSTQELMSAVASGDWAVWESGSAPDVPGRRFWRSPRPSSFTPGAPRTRKIFVRDGSGKVVRMIDRRDGRDWTRTGRS